MKGFVILEEYEQVIYRNMQEVFEELLPYLDQQPPELDLVPGSGLYRVKDHGEKTAFYVLQVTVADEPEAAEFRECDLPQFLEEPLPGEFE